MGKFFKPGTIRKNFASETETVVEHKLVSFKEKVGREWHFVDKKALSLTATSWGGGHVPPVLPSSHVSVCWCTTEDHLIYLASESRSLETREAMLIDQFPCPNSRFMKSSALIPKPGFASLHTLSENSSQDWVPPSNHRVREQTCH